ncbi:MAG: hypothetical protein ABIL09_01170, partial [Gemmatimonadota bacterium]
PPVLVVAARRRRRGVRWVAEEGTAFARLSGGEYLQYPRRPHLDPAGGSLRLRLRLQEPEDPARPQILWGTGLGVPGLMGTQVNAFALGLFGGEGLAFAVQSQRYTRVEVRMPPDEARLTPGRWHDVAAAWGGLNDPRGRPFIEVQLDGCRRRCDDRALFGELERDSQNLRSRATPRVFYVRPNTVLGFGGAVQMPGSATACDLARLELRCPGREPLVADFAAGLAGETGGGDLEWRLHPADLQRAWPRRARLGVGAAAMDLLLALPGDGRMERDEVPYAPSGLAAGSLTRIPPDPGVGRPAARLRAGAGLDDHLVLVFAPAGARARVEAGDSGFVLHAGGHRRAFGLGRRAGAILVAG